jgi:heme/copper-type cytochrome/quinol oxidase subunit 2
MSHNIRVASIAGTLTIVALACIMLAVLLPHTAATSSGEVRIIHLVVRDMAYYVNGRRDANPVLHLRRGERVHIIVNNQDVGMKHDFGIDAWRVRTRLIDGVGEASVEFLTPDVPGDAVYSCTPHGAMMRGTIRIE